MKNTDLFDAVYDGVMMGIIMFGLCICGAVVVTFVKWARGNV